MTVSGDFLDHLLGGHTTICQAWMLTRKDGQVFGFTDHDGDLSFDGVVFKAGTGLSANALSQTTGLSVDNSEASGILSDASVSEADIKSGRFDDAQVTSWIVNWADVGQRAVQFQGNLGEVKMESGEFRAELRGLTERLNQTQGRVYQRTCSAQLGNAACGLDLDHADYTVEVVVSSVVNGNRFGVVGLEAYADRWFENGTLTVLSGAATGLSGHIKSDRKDMTPRRVEVWEQIAGAIAAGDLVRLSVGCDKRAETCRVKFANFLNFRGFPHIPGEDWLVAYPKKSDRNNGGSRY